MNYSDLLDAVNNGYGISVTIPLETLSPDGVVYPPTCKTGRVYSGPLEESTDGKKCSLYRYTQLANEATEANHVEQALLNAIDNGLNVTMPMLQVSHPTIEEYTRSVFELPHRVFDPACRDSMIGDETFHTSEIGKAIIESDAKEVDGLLTYAPYMAVFGGWNSYGGAKAKFPRVLSARVDAENIQIRNAVGESKRDAFNVPKKSGPIFIKKNVEDGIYWELKGPKKEGKDPSKVLWGNTVPNESFAGVVAEHITYRGSISFGAIRALRLRNADTSTQQVMHGYVAALALLLVTIRLNDSFYYRTGCDLLPSKAPTFIVRGKYGEDSEFSLSIDDAVKLYEEALSRLEATGAITVYRDPIKLTFAANAEELLNRTHEEHKKQNTDEEE